MFRLVNGCFIRTDGTKIKRERFKPLNTRTYKSMKIMFHKFLPKYNYKNRILSHLSLCYNGSGFLAFRYSNIKKRYIKFNGYDINSAYQSVLIDKEYPLDSELIRYDNLNISSITAYNKKFKGKKTICWVDVKGIRKKYIDFDYNIYYKQFNTRLDIENGGLIHYGWITDLDLKNFNKLYYFDSINIVCCYVFPNVGRLGNSLATYIQMLYNKLHSMPKGDERKQYKTQVHVCTYGKNAQMYSYGRRSPYVVLALWQVAYVRDYIIKQFIKYNKDTIYIDTDCIYVKSGCKFKENISDKLGDFKHEYKNKYGYFFRGKGYFIYDKNKKFEEQVVSGLNDTLTQKEIDKIYKGVDFHKQVKVKDKTVDYLITNKFLKGYKLKI